MTDLRFALRQLRKNPGFAAVAVLTLALGIGANTAIFTLANGILLRRPPILKPNEVVVISSINPAKGPDRYPASAPEFVRWRQESRSFAQMAASEGDEFILTGEGEPARIAGTRVSSSYFRVLGVDAALGRTFAADEEQIGKDRVVVLSHELWQSRFGSDPSVIGRPIKLNRASYTVIGVMPARFRLLAFPTSLWVPLALGSERLAPAAPEVRSLDVIARLKPRVAVVAAQAELAAIEQRIDQSYPATARGWSATVLQLQRYMIEYIHVEAALAFLSGTVFFVLLIACANIANLLLARAASRQKEFAIRAAVGASRFRLVRQSLIESLLLALAGGGLGLLLANWALNSLRAALNWNAFVRLIANETRVDTGVLAFTLGLSVLAALLFGLVPAIRATATNLNLTLKEGGWNPSVVFTRGRSRSVLVVAETGLALALLIGAGLFMEQFVHALYHGFGIDPKGVATAKVTLPPRDYGDSARQTAFVRKLLERVASSPEVASAGVTTLLPPSEEGRSVSFNIRERPAPTREARPQTRYFAVSEQFLQTLRIPLIQGRCFSDFDDARAPGVVLVNEAFVKRFFPNESPLGKHLTLETGETNRLAWSEIVGVVGNVTDWFGEPRPTPQIYQPILQSPAADLTLVARTSLDAATLGEALRRAVWDVDKDLPITEVRTMERVIADASGGDRLMSQLMGLFAGLALALATIGVFGVIGYNVAQRRREIGIRMALGAQKQDVVHLVVGKGMLVAGLGALSGLVLALPLPGLMTAAFTGFNTRPTPIFLGALSVITFVAFLASYIPARRASRIDPMVPLRYE